MEGSELELAKVPVENKTGGGERVAPEGPVEGPSLNPEVVGALFLSLVEAGGRSRQPPS